MTDADSTPNAYQESLSVSNQRKIPGHNITRTRQHLSLWCWGVGLLMAICATTNFVVTTASHVDLIYGLPAQQVTLVAMASFVTLLAGFLVFGRLRRNSCLNELALDGCEVLFDDDESHERLDTVPQRELIERIEYAASLSLEKLRPSISQQGAQATAAFCGGQVSLAAAEAFQALRLVW